MEMEKVLIIGAIIVGAYFILDKLGQFSEGIGEAAGGVGEFFGKTATGVGEFGGDVATGVGEFGGDVATGIGEFAEQSGDIIQTVVETPGDIAGGIGEFAGDVATGIGEFFGGIIHPTGFDPAKQPVDEKPTQKIRPSPKIGTIENVLEPAWVQQTEMVADPGRVESPGGWIGGR